MPSLSSLVGSRTALAAAVCLLFVRLCRPSGIGRCPKKEYMAGFDMTKFAGHWYEIERTFYLVELAYGCTTMDLTLNGRGQFEVDVRARSRITGSVSISEGVATQARKDPSVFLYRVNSSLPAIIARHLPGSGFYQILDTDYDSFAVMWRCTSLAILHIDQVWVWGRSKEMDVTLRTHVYKLLEQRQLDSERLVLPKNTNCTDEDY